MNLLLNRLHKMNRIYSCIKKYRIFYWIYNKENHLKMIFIKMFYIKLWKYSIKVNLSGIERKRQQVPRNIHANLCIDIYRIFIKIAFSVLLARNIGNFVKWTNPQKYCWLLYKFMAAISSIIFNRLWTFLL